MSDEQPPHGPRAPKRPRLSGMAALHGELADPLPRLDIPSEPPASAPPPMADIGEEPPPPPKDDAELLRGEDFGRWAEPEAPKRSIDTMVGKVVDGRYEIREMIGRGGMGAVFEAFQPSVQRTVALKVLLREFAENETIIKRFHKEALAASRLTHPNTISVYDFGQTDDGILFIAMEYLRGENLAEVLDREGRLDTARALGIMRQVCKSLGEAHKAGIIHRDLKPDNVFLTEIEGERDFVKVLDFGVAKLREGDGGERTLTQAGTMFGTPKYMSPEQTRSTQLDARSDIYSLGVILYEMLLGEPPFVSDNPLSILIAHVNEQPAPFADRQPDLDIHPAVEAVVFQALSKAREDRQRDVETLLDQVEALIALEAGTPFADVADRLPDPAAFGLGAVAAPPVVDAVPDIADVVLDEGPSSSRESRPGPPLLPIAIGVVAAVGALVFAFSPSGDPPPSTPPVERAAVAPPSPVAPPAPPLDAAVPDAAPSRQFVIETDPVGVSIVRAADDVEVGATRDAPGQTLVRLTLDEATAFVARRRGYQPARFTIDPTDPEADRVVRVALLKTPPPRPRPARRDDRGERAGAAARPDIQRPPAAKIIAAPPPPPPPATPDPEPVPIELMN